MSGESIVLVKAAAAPATDAAADEGVEETGEPEGDEVDPVVAAAEEANAENGRGGAPPAARHNKAAVSINVDSASDPDKLEKQPKLLREYGLI